MPNASSQSGTFIGKSLTLVLVLFALAQAWVWNPAPVAAAGTYYVATSGNDSTGTGTSSKPWKTLQKAADSIGTGSTVLIKPGTYTQAVEININATASSPVIFRGDGAGVIVNAATVDRDAIYINESSYVTFENVRINNAPRAGLRVSASDHIRIRNNVFANNLRWGLFTDFSDDLLIEGNQSFGATIEHGIYVSNSGDRPVVRGNVIHDNYANGLHMNGDLSQGGDGIITGGTVEGNILYDNGAGGGSAINMDGVSNTMVRNNLIYNTHSTGISMYQIDGGTCSKNNKIYNNTIVIASDGRWAINIPDSGCTGNKIISNILYSNHSYRGAINLVPDSESGFESDYNVLEGTFTQDDGDSILSFSAWKALGFDSHSKVATPAQLFVNANSDFRLKTGSPAIDAGQTLTAVRKDIAGAPRPQGARSDAGAYEAASAAAIPNCTLAPTSGVVYSKTTATCSGFKSGEYITLAWDGSDITNKRASSGGNATIVIQIPRGVTGRHLIKPTGDQGSVVPSRGYRIVPSINPSPTGGVSGQTISVALRGYAASEVIRIRFRTAPGSSRTVASNVIASSTGTATATFKVPAGSAGAYSVEGEGSLGGFASAKFTRIVRTADEPTVVPISTATATATPSPTQTATDVPPTIEPTSTQVSPTEIPPPVASPVA